MAFTRDDLGVLVRLRPAEARVVLDLARQLVDMLEDRAAESPADMLYAQLGIGGPSDPPLDPAMARLLPDAYRDDEGAASEHRHLTERGLVARKVANAEVVIATIERASGRLDDAAAGAWLRTLTDLRLTIAARLQIENDGDTGVGDDAMLDLYEWLGYLQGSLVDSVEDWTMP